MPRLCSACSTRHGLDILELRARGWTYHRLARAYALSRDAVRRHCLHCDAHQGLNAALAAETRRRALLIDAIAGQLRDIAADNPATTSETTIALRRLDELHAADQLLHHILRSYFQGGGAWHQIVAALEPLCDV